MLQHNCDLVNMSYGEPALLPDYGRFVDLVTEVSFNPLSLLGSTSLFVFYAFHLAFVVCYVLGCEQETPNICK